MPLLAELIVVLPYRCYKDFAPTELGMASAVALPPDQQELIPTEWMSGTVSRKERAAIDRDCLTRDKCILNQE